MVMTYATLVNIHRDRQLLTRYTATSHSLFKNYTYKHAIELVVQLIIKNTLT